jgi:hypothetical protein
MRAKAAIQARECDPRSLAASTFRAKPESQIDQSHCLHEATHRHLRRPRSGGKTARQ